MSMEELFKKYGRDHFRWAHRVHDTWYTLNTSNTLDNEK